MKVGRNSFSVSLTIRSITVHIFRVKRDVLTKGLRTHKWRVERLPVRQTLVWAGPLFFIFVKGV